LLPREVVRPLGKRRPPATMAYDAASHTPRIVGQLRLRRIVWVGGSVHRGCAAGHTRARASADPVPPVPGILHASEWNTPHAHACARGRTSGERTYADGSSLISTWRAMSENYLQVNGIGSGAFLPLLSRNGPFVCGRPWGSSVFAPPALSPIRSPLRVCTSKKHSVSAACSKQPCSMFLQQCIAYAPKPSIGHRKLHEQRQNNWGLGVKATAAPPQSSDVMVSATFHIRPVPACEIHHPCAPALPVRIRSL
jgi:hypothetical protein